MQRTVRSPYSWHCFEFLEDEREPVQTPKAIADGVIAWLKKNSVSQALFAEKILSRKQSTLSDVLRQPPAELPKGQGKWIYEKMENFLNDKQEQQATTYCSQTRYLGFISFSKYILGYNSRRT